MESEKTHLLALGQPTTDNVEAQPLERPQKHHVVRLMAAMILALMTVRLWLWGDLTSDQQPHYYDYDEIEASTSLDWRPCYGENFFCAKLRVPMDYHRPLNGSGNPHVDLALVLYPAPGSGGAAWSRTPMLFNPGGPGGSGVDFLQGRAPQLQQIVGGKYDLVSFDPRGIGHTRPSADCFAYPSNGKVPSYADRQLGDAQRQLYEYELAGHGLFNYSSRSTLDIDARNRALAQTCAEKDAVQGENSLLRHIATPNVAQDMVSIIDAWKEWRHAQVSKHNCKPTCFDQLDIPAEDDPEGKLVYWGFSYGTLLGATFAAMFPDRVHRVILDGVVDADHYVSPTWSESLTNADDILDQFVHYCHEAKANCELYRKADSEADISARLDSLLQSLKYTPLYGVGRGTHAPAIIEYHMVKSLFFISLYAPVNNFRYFAGILNRLLLAYEGGDLPLANEIQQSSGLAIGVDSQRSIMCGDKRYALNDTIPGLEERYKQIAKTSSFADVWMTLMDVCSGWDIPIKDPPMRWDDHPAKKTKPIKTRFPVLFLSNTYDPVTPLVAGHLMARKFVDAGLVQLKTEGHCTLAAVSKCMTKTIRRYFDEGLVPRAPGDWKSRDWETCEADETPWNPYVPLSQQSIDAVSDRQARDMHHTMKAWKELQQFANSRGDFGYGRNRLPSLNVDLNV